MIYQSFYIILIKQMTPNCSQGPYNPLCPPPRKQFKQDSSIEYHWERLPDTFHGSGCTLSSRIAALLALGNDLKKSVEKAQEYTWLSLKHGMKLGRGQAQPNRFYE